jgi:CheY-like chemotaxis protein
LSFRPRRGRRDLITAYGDAETKRKALENGTEALLTKPIGYATLRNEDRHAG